MVSRTTIQEANKHLHAMHLHSTYLENSLRECKEIMKQNEEKYFEHIQSLRKEANDKILEVNSELEKIQSEKQQLGKLVEERDTEIRILKGRLSVFKQIFQFLPGLKSFIGVIENARQLTKDDDSDSYNIPNDVNLHELHMSVPSIAKHNIPNGQVKTLSISSNDDESDEETHGRSAGKGDTSVKSGAINNVRFDNTAEVYL